MKRVCFFLISIFFAAPAFAQDIVVEERKIGDRTFELIDDVWLEVADDDALRAVRYLSATLWPNGKLPIDFAPGYPAAGQSIVRQACSDLEAVSSVRCVDRTDEADFVVFEKSTVNQSYLGMIGGGQKIELFNTGSKGIVTHEILHALGFLHQHQSPNRDIYIRVEFDNIQPGKEHNFDAVSNALAVGEYDFCSIMHYGLNAFSNGNGATIVVRGTQPSCTIGQRTALTVQDMLGLAEAYGADPGDTKFVVVPDLTKAYWSFGGNEERIRRLYGLSLNIAEKYSHGRPVDEFPRPAGPGEMGQDKCTITQCDYRASNQSLMPGALVEFGAGVNIRLTQTCYPMEWC